MITIADLEYIEHRMAEIPRPSEMDLRGWVDSLVKEVAGSWEAIANVTIATNDAFSDLNDYMRSRTP